LRERGERCCNPVITGTPFALVWVSRLFMNEIDNATSMPCATADIVSTGLAAMLGRSE
jgi:hypothetical protein